MSDVGVMLEIYLEFHPCYERLIVLAFDYDFISSWDSLLRVDLVEVGS